ncbi:MAG: acetyl-CoA carboxylase biotin carboxylase subunit [Candidatus Binatus sp.]|uniref:acetyl-CoA carboxylase biotin carboxylase subunit n=1 Tax=Candidatus Binatus sp. TaxID=2811406 RepID=UPI0027226B67|nr:acetyl-CoA carboxylase biotin carboxylase subunit [Candidatus Binatus sp.]MDO8431493.1 acetyl-CoA carboxylase biotin carboxylase subunit [Candidatus Binatus sp.]
MFKRILIANRGEIAVRIIRACREMGIESVAVYSEADRAALHVREADRAYPIGPSPAAESYLNTAKILEAAERTGADAVHPGYGFFSERAAFARAVQEAGLTWIGPPPEAIERMGDKVEARKIMSAAAVPVVPGSPGTLETEEEVIAIARAIGFPIMVKAAAGGGGKGLRFVEDEKNLASIVRTVASEAKSSFGDGRFYVEKFLKQPRHIEVQVLADQYGNIVHVFERECSIQRRHQKVVEESPSPFITDGMRRAMGEVAVRAARAAEYVSAGTVEFLVDADRNFYFLEMNTRIQVEHPVTEMVTGVDLVRTQIEIAAGAKLPFKQDDLSQRGWAIECRIYAEDPAAGFMPSPGKIETVRFPEGPGVRNDAGVYAGAEVSVFYDPMISKLTVWGADRAQAIDRMRRALGEFVISGELRTNLDFHRWIITHPRFLAGNFDTNFIDAEYRPHDGAQSGPANDELAAILTAAIASNRQVLHANGAAPQAAASPAPAARSSAWRAVGRLDMLRR